MTGIDILPLELPFINITFSLGYSFYSIQEHEVKRFCLYLHHPRSPLFLALPVVIAGLIACTL